MGDQHWCSSCAQDQKGKQHIKIVFENWPLKVTQTYRRKGQVRRQTKAQTREIITALCMECLANPEKWKTTPEAGGGTPLTDLFSYLATIGKNPTFEAILTKNGPLCLVNPCSHRLGDPCQHTQHLGSDVVGLDILSCMVGHPGEELIRPRPQEKGLKRLRTSLKDWLPAVKRQPKILTFLFFFWILPCIIVWACGLPVWIGFWLYHLVRKSLRLMTFNRRFGA